MTDQSVRNAKHSDAQPMKMHNQNNPDVPAWDETGLRILDAAISHFARHGYGRTTVEPIATAARVGHGTVFRRFKSKQELFFAALRHCLDSASAYVRERIEGMTDPIATIRAIARHRAEYCARHPEMVALLIVECAEFRTATYLTHLRGRHGNLDFLSNLMLRASLTGRSVPVTSPYEAAVAFMDVTFGAAVNGHFDGDREGLVKRAETVVELFLRGLVGDGIDALEADVQPVEPLAPGVDAPRRDDALLALDAHERHERGGTPQNPLGT